MTKPNKKVPRALNLEKMKPVKEGARSRLINIIS